MTDAFFQSVQRVFQGARARDGAERDAYLDEACAGDEQLRAEVDSLLEIYDRKDDRFTAEVLDSEGNPAPGATAGAEPAPDTIGRYRVLRPLGEGGMGVVHLARQDGTGQKVALKLIRTGLRSPRVLRRFEHEAEILGRLRHPGIARVHDAGVHDGIPFIAMELVEGPDLITHARNADLTVKDRIELMIRVCDAVQHAHQRGIIHRDLKPGNILVETDASDHDGTGQPKVLDFGIAREMDAEVTVGGHSTAGNLLGTLQYMSPEQARGDPDGLDARSDVYALGVILYQLLTGRPPHAIDDRPIHEVLRRIIDDDPIPLGSADRRFRGDLAAIVAKALQKDRGRRYQSASELAGDLRRYVADEPITAHPPSAMYQVGKFARRHRAMVGGAVAVGLVLLIGTITTSIYAVMASRAERAEAAARRRAQERFDEVRALANTFIFDVHDSIRRLPGSLEARRLLVDTGQTYLDRLAAESDDDPTLQRELAQAYLRLGDVQGDVLEASLGRVTEALESYRRALSLLEGADIGDPAQRDDDLILAHQKLGDLLDRMNREEASLEAYGAALRIAEAGAADRPERLRSQRDLSVACERYGRMLLALGRLEEGRALESRSRRILRELAAEHPDDLTVQRDVAVTYLYDGHRARADRNLEPALDHFRAYLEIVDRLLGADPLNTTYQRDRMVAFENLGSVHALRGDYPGAAADYGRAIETGRALLASDEGNVAFLRAMCAPACWLADLQMQQDEVDAALPNYKLYMKSASAAAAADPMSRPAHRDYGVALYKLGVWHAGRAADGAVVAPARLDHWRQARGWFDRSHAQFLAMGDRGLLAPEDAGVPDELAGEVARCDAAIIGLQSVGGGP